MQYFYLPLERFSIFQACLLHCGHHMNVRIEKIMKISQNYLIDGFKSGGGETSKVTKLFYGL